MKRIFRITILSLIAAAAMSLAGCREESNPEYSYSDKFQDENDTGYVSSNLQTPLFKCALEYTLNSDGTIKVVNAGYKDSFDGKYDEAIGKARRPNDAEPGKLEVAFFWNFYAPYYVLELADDYRYALIGSKKSKYLWILSRTPRMNDVDLDYVLTSAQNRGYNTNELIWVEQKGE